MKTATIAGCAVCLVLGAAVGWFASSGDAAETKALEVSVAESEQALKSTTQERTKLEAELRDLRTRSRNTERELDQARKDVARVQAQLDAAVADASTDVVAENTGAGWRSRVKGYPAYLGDYHQDAMKKIDWTVIAENMNAMVPLLVTLAEALANGEEMPAEEIGKIQQHNGPLVTVAVTLSQEQVPGTGPNGSFTYPTFMANAIAATLEAAGKPLSASQSAAIDELETAFSRRDAERLMGYADGVVELKKVVDESDLKHTFFTDLFKVLSEEQGNALSPPAVRGRTSIDLFNEGLLWTGRAGPRSFRDRAHLTEEVGKMVIQQFDLPDEVQGEARTIVADWAGGLPQSMIDRETDKLSESGMMLSVDVAESGRHFSDLLQAMADELALDEEHVKRVRSFNRTIVTYHAADGN